MKLNKLIFALLILFSVVIFIIGFLISYDYLIEDLNSSTNRLSSIRSIGEYSIMYLSFICIIFYLFQFKKIRLIPIFFIIVLSINLFISYCCYFVYGTGFNIGMAVSVLDSNIYEAANMVTSYLIPLLIICLYLTINLLLLKQSIKYTFSKYFFLFGTLWIVLPIAFYMKHHIIGAKNGKPMVKNIFYHYKDFNAAYDLQKRMDEVKLHNINYTYKKEHEGIETIVILVGESGRKQNMQLYGYERNTTPIQLSELQNMILYQNAFSPAGITNLSIPLTLSKIDHDSFPSNLSDLADNIINLGNHYDYNTTWLTTQNNIKGVTEIASFAKNKKWINGYDFEILREYKKLFTSKEKQLVVIHINGSHPNPCLRYPNNKQYFNDNNFLDCYDNSIKYTDDLIGELLNPLKGKNAAFIYLTDHGLKKSDGKLFHTDSKESTQVPFYIWFGNKELKEKITFSKNTDETISLSYLYPVVMKLIGLDEVKLDKVEKQKYLQLNHKSINYNELME